MLFERNSDDRRELSGRRGTDRRQQSIPMAMDRRMGNRRSSLDRRIYLDRRLAAVSITDIL
ncbi:MAG: hypothetical protein IIB42_00925 [Candidatus Marinimicrobia bacterium]|nr:hypothetical protein [Candidatus Neomarinimicrobiota bacterium]